MAKVAQVINQIVRVADCTPHPRNYNQHDPSQITDLRDSLHHFGQVRSIVVQATARSNGHKSWLTVAGHGLIEAAKLEGVDRLRADVIPATWRPARVLAYLAADNELARRGNPDQAQLAVLVAEVQRREGDELARLAAGEQKAMDVLLHWSFHPPTFDELRNEYGEPGERDFWPLIHIQVSPETHGKYKALLSILPGIDEAEKFNALISRWC